MVAGDGWNNRRTLLALRSVVERPGRPSAFAQTALAAYAGRGAPMTRSDLFSRSGIRAIVAYLLIWAAALAYLAVRGADWTFPIAVLVIFGLILGGIIWFLTRKMNAPAVPVAHPQRESVGLLAYLAIYGVLL